jgi:hypothetical protein
MTVSKVLVVGGGIRGRPFFSAASFRVETPPGGQPRNVTVALEGMGTYRCSAQSAMRCQTGCSSTRCDRFRTRSTCCR